MMRQRLLSSDEVLAGYDAIVKLYPFIPPLSAWRAWEYAAFRHYTLQEPVLDLGCGDGRLFRLVWPSISQVVGVDIDPQMVQLARRSAVYQAVYLASASRLPVKPKTFASVFANSSIEHMDDLAGVLASVHESLVADGIFLLTVVTEKFVEWELLPRLAAVLATPERGDRVLHDYLDYHHLVNPLPVRGWVDALERAGFEVIEHVPVIPELFGRLFLVLDQLWHLPGPGGEHGSAIQPYLSSLPRFPEAFRQVLSGILDMERDWETCVGAVFLARKVDA